MLKTTVRALSVSISKPHIHLRVFKDRNLGEIVYTLGPSLGVGGHEMRRVWGMHLFMMNIFAFHEELGDNVPVWIDDGESLNRTSVSKNTHSCF